MIEKTHLWLQLLHTLASKPYCFAGSIKQADGSGRTDPTTAAAPMVCLLSESNCIKLINILGRNTTPAAPAHMDTRETHGGHIERYIKGGMYEEEAYRGTYIEGRTEGHTEGRIEGHRVGHTRKDGRKDIHREMQRDRRRDRWRDLRRDTPRDKMKSHGRTHGVT